MNYRIKGFSIILFGSVFPLAQASAFNLSFSDGDFATTTVFSEVTTFEFYVENSDTLGPGLSYRDPSILDIQYSVSGTLDVTPSGFPAFGFQLDHIFPSSPPIIGTQFYALNPDAAPGDTLSFDIAPSANLADGLQLDELLELPSAQFGSGVIFQFNGREKGTGRYHPIFIQLRSDGTGIIQNADNQGGVNPQDGSPDEIDIDFGEEYITNLTFDPATFTLAIPEPSSSTLLIAGVLLPLARRSRR